MQKVLRKRILRDLKKNLMRYLALSILIIASMYMVISLVDAADMIIVGRQRYNKKNHVESGCFTTFVKLSDSDRQRLKDKGAQIEEEFYVDFLQEDKSTLRITKVREKINLIEIDKGALPQNDNEILLEKRYAQEHKLKVSDSIIIAGESYKISGIGCTPDYDAPYEKIGDSTVSSKTFGVGFVTGNQYKKLSNSENLYKAEELLYAYVLQDGLTHSALKNELSKIRVSPKNIEDEYFQKYWEENIADADKVTDGVGELKDGSNKLTDSLSEVNSNNSNLQDAAKKLFDNYLKSAGESLKSYGLKDNLTEENFEEKIKKIADNAESSIVNMSISSALEDLKNLKKFKDGIIDYTEAVEKIGKGQKKVDEGINKLDDKVDEIKKEYFVTDIENLVTFIKASDNPRINASSNDQIINKYAGLVAGAIVLILFAYVISVFVIHGIDEESTIIGALYVLGVTERDLLKHYLFLPVIVTAVSGLVGALLGFSDFALDSQMVDNNAYFSTPNFDYYYAPYLIVYALILPPLMALLVNVFVIRKRLNQPVLKLIRNEKNEKIKTGFDIDKFGFIKKFQIRQIMRESRSALAVVLGMFICLLIMFIGINCFVMCESIKENYVKDTKFKYMYTLKYPGKKAPDDSHKAFAKTLKKEVYGYNLDITVLGVDKDNPYFDATIYKSKNKVSISSAMAQKYGIKEGEQIIVSDEINDVDYAFIVKKIVNYSTGFYIFMDIKSMCELFGEDEDYYNVLFSDKELSIKSGRVYSVLTKDSIKKSSGVFVDLMKGMVYSMCIMSMIIFIVVMYLMMKVMLDRSAQNIAIIKIFGFRPGEIRKLYLNGNFYIISIGAIIIIPLAKLIMDALYPYMIANVACAMDLKYPIYYYPVLVGMIIVFYFIINRILIFRINRMKPTEVLKNRE